jgi:hypothetical protein
MRGRSITHGTPCHAIRWGESLMLRPLLAALAAAMLVAYNALAHGPSRQKVEKSVTVNAPAAKVWNLIRDFCSIKDWHPAIAACAGAGGNEPGATRVLSLDTPDGPKVHEELMAYDGARMTYKYKITEVDVAVLPVTTYSSQLGVKDNGDGTSAVTWRGGFYRGFPNNDPPPELSDEAAVKAISRVYDAGLARIKELAEQ